VAHSGRLLPCLQARLAEYKLANLFSRSSVRKKKSLLVLILGLVIVKYLRTINIVNTTFGTFENVFSMLDFFNSDVSSGNKTLYDNLKSPKME
jgi:hypothetical protein